MPAALRGALWMVGALLSFSLMAVSVRELLRTMGSFEILFLRSLVSFVLVLVVLPRFGLGALRTRHFGLHLVRNVLHFSGQYAWVYAIAMLPLATVFAIEFTMPVWTALLAIPILGERLNRGRTVMLVLGLAGILVILKPGFGVVHPAALVMLAGSFAYASTMIATKRLSGSDSALAVVFYMSVVQLPLAFVPALPGWVAPALVDLPWIRDRRGRAERALLLDARHAHRRCDSGGSDRFPTAAADRRGGDALLRRAAGILDHAGGSDDFCRNVLQRPARKPKTGERRCVGTLLLLAGNRRQRAQVGDQSVEVRRRELAGGVLDDFAHRLCDDVAFRVEARS